MTGGKVMIITTTGIQDGAIGTTAGVKDMIKTGATAGVKEMIMTGTTVGGRATIGEVGAMTETGAMDGAKISAGEMVAEIWVESGMMKRITQHSPQPYHQPCRQHFTRLSIPQYRLHTR